MYCAIRGSQAWNSNDSRIARRMALLVFTDFICWAPIAFFSLTAVCGLQLVSLEEAKVFAIFVLPLNSCANPFLYAIFTKQFKKDCIHICKRIEESRVTRGIGRGRHSSNFSNRQTPVTTNSAAAAATPGSDSEPHRARMLSSSVCRCSKTSWKPKERTRNGWKEWAFKYVLCRGKESEQNPADSYTYAIAQIQRNNEKRNKHTTSISSENFSSRSDSWRQGNIPLRLMDQETRQGSWRKTSEDSNMSCSRQDSSTSTFHMSRSSFSSDSSSQPRSARPLLGNAILNNRESFRVGREKPKLCRQSAVTDDKSQSLNRHELNRKIPKEKTVEGLCPVCARKEGFKSKELEEKFACFYNRLVESSYGESSDTFSSKEDQIVLSSEGHSAETKAETSNDSQVPKPSSSSIQNPRIEINPISEDKSVAISMNDAVKESSNHEADQKSHYHLDARDQGKEKSQSLINISTKINSEGTKKASSDNSLTKLSLSTLPAIFKSLTNRGASVEKDTVFVAPKIVTVLRSSKSENVVKDCAKENERTYASSNFLIRRSESSNNGSLHTNLLSANVSKESDIKASSSSPNIRVKCYETSPLIDNDE